jgi:hypothetical protein
MLSFHFSVVLISSSESPSGSVLFHLGILEKMKSDRTNLIACRANHENRLI